MVFPSKLSHEAVTMVAVAFLPRSNSTAVASFSEDAVADYNTVSIEGDAENGFILTNQVIIEVEEEDVPLLPSTGDNIGLVMVVAMMSMAGAAVCVLKSKKENA